MNSGLKVLGLIYIYSGQKLLCERGLIGQSSICMEGNFVRADVTCVPDNAESAALRPGLASVQLIHLWLVMLLCP